MIILTSIAILLVFVVVAVKLNHDYGQWKKENYTIKHQVEWWQAAAGSLPSILLFTYSSGRNWFFTPLPEWIAVVLTVVLSALICAFVIWFLFDGFYNVLRKFNWWHLGTDDKDDAKTDNFLQKLPLWLHIAIKVVGLVSTGVLYYLTYR